MNKRPLRGRTTQPRVRAPQERMTLGRRTHYYPRLRRTLESYPRIAVVRPRRSSGSGCKGGSVTPGQALLRSSDPGLNYTTPTGSGGGGYSVFPGVFGALRLDTRATKKAPLRGAASQLHPPLFPKRYPYGGGQKVSYWKQFASIRQIVFFPTGNIWLLSVKFFGLMWRWKTRRDF